MRRDVGDSTPLLPLSLLPPGLPKLRRGFGQRQRDARQAVAAGQLLLPAPIRPAPAHRLGAKVAPADRRDGHGAEPGQRVEGAHRHQQEVSEPKLQTFHKETLVHWSGVTERPNQSCINVFMWPPAVCLRETVGIVRFTGLYLSMEAICLQTLLGYQNKTANYGSTLLPS